MKVLFLDIDGVINTVGAELGFRYCLGRQEQEHMFDPACLYYLRNIVEETGCRIVISSTWRLGASLEEMKDWFECPIIKEAIIDKTPSLSSLSNPELKDRRGRVQRGEEIKLWLDAQPKVTRFAVIDDDTDMDVIKDNFFQTCSYDGLKKDVSKSVITHLNKEFILDHYRMNNNLNSFIFELRSCYDAVDNYKEYENSIIKIIKEMNNKYREKRCI